MSLIRLGKELTPVCESKTSDLALCHFAGGLEPGASCSGNFIAWFREVFEAIMRVCRQVTATDPVEKKEGPSGASLVVVLTNAVFLVITISVATIAAVVIVIIAVIVIIPATTRWGAVKPLSKSHV